MKVTVTAARDFPRMSGDGQSRYLVLEGQEIEVPLTEARKLKDQGKVHPFVEPGPPKIGKNKEE